jgi:hypothetical protein
VSENKFPYCTNGEQRQNDRGLNMAEFIGAVVVGAVLLIAIAGFFVFPTEQDERAEFAKIVVQIVGGAIILVGLRFTYLTLMLSAESDRRADKQLVIELQSKDADRFFKASEQLGSNEEAVRIAALYSLERIANERDDYYHQVIEVICSFIRGRSEVDRAGFEGYDQMPEKFPRTSNDIEAAFKVLARRKYMLGAGEKAPLDLRRANLCGLKITSADFQESDFSNALMIDISISKSNLSGANFALADLRWAAFTETNFIGTTFVVARLDDARFFYPPEVAEPSPTMALQSSFWSINDWRTHYERVDQEPVGLVASGRLFDHSNWHLATVEGVYFAVSDISGIKNLTPFARDYLEDQVENYMGHVEAHRNRYGPWGL